ncbi:MAG: PAS domain S-box protein [Chloroflexi bacterium]|nr:PAS domain S-box protein [Chloroflexota bacterium]
MQKQESGLDSAIYEALIESMPDAMIYINFEREIQMVNRAFATLFGYERDELLGKSTRLLYADEATFEEAGRRFFNVNTTEAGNAHKFTFCRKDGTVFAGQITFDFVETKTGEQLGFLGYIRDITETMRLEYETERLYELSVDMIGIASRDGTFRRLSPSWEAMLGFSLDELMQMNAYQMVHPDDLMRAQQEAQTAGVNQPTRNFDVRFLCKDGSYKWLSWNSIPDNLNDNVYFIVRDVSQQKEMQDRLTRQRENLLALYEVTSTSELDVDDQLMALLALGCQRFGVTDGLLTRIDESDTLVTTHALASRAISYTVGDVIPVKQAYCQRVLTSHDVFAEHHISQSDQYDPVVTDPSEVYIGAPLYLDGDRYGTMVFMQEAPREQAFDDVDREFMRMLGQWASTMITRQVSRSEIERIFNVSVDIIAILDDSGNFLRISPSMERALGYIPAEMVGHNVEKFLHLDDLDRSSELAYQMWAAQEEFAIQGFVNRWRHKNGSLRYLRWTASTYPGTKIVYAIGHDITRDVEVQSALETRHRNLQSIFDVTSNPELLPDNKINTLLELGCEVLGMEAGIILKADDEQHAIMIYAAGPTLLPVGHILLDDLSTRLVKSVPAFVADRSQMPDTWYCSIDPLMTVRACCSLPLHINNEFYGIMKFASAQPHDGGFSETERDFMQLMGQLVEAILASKINHDELEIIYNLTTDIMMVVNMQGYVERVSPSVEALYGYTPEEFMARRQNEFVHPDDRERTMDISVSAIRSARQSGAFRLENRYLCKDGSFRWMSWVAVTDRTTEYIYVIGRDITENKRLETDLRAANEEMEMRVRERTAELERAYEELKSYAYIISHDLRTPMINIQGFLNELAMSVNMIVPVMRSQLDSVPHEKRQPLQNAIERDIPEAIRFIDIAVTNMDRMIRSLLTLSRYGNRPLEFQHLDLNEIVAEQLDLLAHQINQQSATVIVGDLPVITGDRGALRIILANILKNAVQYLDADRPGQIKIYHLDGESHWTIAIEDNGRGIEARHADKVFEIFRRVGSQDTEGEGMGLAYVQTLVRRHDGQLWFESEFGKGTTFYFSIARPLES